VCGARCNGIRPTVGQLRREREEKRKAGRERIQHKWPHCKRFARSRAGAAATVDASSLQRSRRHPCRRGAAQTDARYVKVGHPARTTLSRRCAAGTAAAVATAVVAGIASLMLQLSSSLWERLSRFSGMSQNNHG